MILGRSLGRAESFSELPRITHMLSFLLCSVYIDSYLMGLSAIFVLCVSYFD